MRRLCLYTLLLLLGLPAAASAVDETQLDDSRRQLERIEQRLEQAIADLAAKKATERDLSSDLRDIDRQLAQMRRQVEESRQKLSAVDSEIDRAQADLDRARKEVDTLRLQVQQRLIALYKSEEAGVLKALFSAGNLGQLFEDYDFFGRVVAHDRQLLTEFRTKVQQRQAALDRLAGIRLRHQAVAADLLQREKELRRTQQIKQRFLVAVRKDRSALNAIIGDLQERASRLTALVDDLSASPAAPVSAETSLFALQKGVLPWPVTGPLKVGFGRTRHPDLGTLFDSQGIEIGALPATAVRAVWGGRVAFAKSFKGYGNLMIIDHDGSYYTLYAQIDRLQKTAGDPVKQGEVIAYTGFEGADHLYFEIRQGRSPLDPLPWIEKR